MMSTITQPLDALAWYGRNIIAHYHDKISTKRLDLHKITQAPRRRLLAASSDQPICIIGAGVGGLYAAMMLRSVGIPFKIIEASDRAGGRLFTYYFDESVPYDYYDVGAMRFPMTPVMDRTFRLFQTLDLPLLDYIFEEPASIMLYNEVRQPKTDDGKPSLWNIQTIPSPYSQYSWAELVDNVVKPFADAIAQDIENHTSTGWELMMKYDQYSTRAYMSGNRSDMQPDLDLLNEMPYPTSVVNWLETFDTSTGSYDEALSETVMDAVAFSFPGEDPISWKCVDGGSQKIVDGMLASLNLTAEELSLNSKVVRIQSGDGLVEVTSIDDLGNTKTDAFGHVITTTTLPCLQTIDTTGADLDYEQTSALRELAYGSAVKIGVKFRTAWWLDQDAMPYGPLNGGQSVTDRLVRTVVYPSYGAEQRSTVLIVSYTWTSDAIRWGPLLDDPARLKDIVLRDLADIHDVPRAFLEDQWVDHYPFSWTNSPYTMGAFGLFGPGQFSDVLTNLTRPASEGRLHFAGEAVSTHHAWVVGALEASYRAVKTIISTDYPELSDTFVQLWGEDALWSREAVLKQFAISCPEWEASLKA